MKKVLFIMVAIFFLLGITTRSAAQPAPKAGESVVAPQVPAVPEVVPQGSLPAPQVVSPALETPPAWIVSALETIYKIPVIGPLVAKVMQWLGVLAVIMTSLLVFLLTSVRALMGVANFAGLISFAAWLEVFKDSKIIYYLKYFSLGNAQK